MEQSENGLFFVKALWTNYEAKSDWNTVKQWSPGDGPVWIHLDRTHPNTEEWLRQSSGLTPVTVDALLHEESRPRVFRGKRGTVAILRGMNLNPGQSREDMIDLRIWSEGERLITLRKSRLQTIEDVLGFLEDPSEGPSSISELYVALITTLNNRMSPTIENLRLKVDHVEHDSDLAHAKDVREGLMAIRNEAVSLKRYLAPQRLALNELMRTPPKWADDTWVSVMREATDTLAYYIEELDAARDHAVVIKDDIASQMADATNRTLYALAVISGIFLPLAFLTGLLGVNVGGMPGIENQYAFWALCLILTLFGILEVVLLKKLRWI